MYVSLLPHISGGLLNTHSNFVLLPCKSQQFILKTDDIEEKGKRGQLIPFSSSPLISGWRWNVLVESTHIKQWNKHSWVGVCSISTALAGTKINMDVRAVKHSESHWGKIQVLARLGSLPDSGLELFSCLFQHPEAAAFLSSWHLSHLQSQQ